MGAPVLAPHGTLVSVFGDTFAGERVGLLSCRRATPYRVLTSPAAPLPQAPFQLPLLGSSWADEDPAGGRVAQLYGGYVLPGSRADRTGGVGLMVSQWNTAHGWPYRVMQFRATLLSDARSRYGRPAPTNLWNTAPRPRPSSVSTGTDERYRDQAEKFLGELLASWRISPPNFGEGYQS